MRELRVPTIATPAQVTCADGTVLSGRVFVPAAAFRHSGPMRTEEWINEPAQFFPFLPDKADRALLLNKEQVVVVSLAAPAPADDPAAGDEEASAHQVTVECGSLRLQGELKVAMPEGHRRVLDVMNRPERFVALRADAHQHLVHKRYVSRVLENRGP